MSLNASKRKPKCDAMFAHMDAGGRKEDGPLVDVSDVAWEHFEYIVDE
ncbi:hypothetical protein [Stutzerimonas stutzeri]|nr:hypothetical protein [Stutzerimonas stutzeri]